MQQRRTTGFTLIEVLFAVFIIGGALVVFAGVLMGTTRQARSGSTTTQAVQLATQIIEEQTALVKRGEAPSVTCGASHQNYEINDTDYQVVTTLSKKTLNPTTGNLVDANCGESEPAAYHLELVLSWQQDGVEQSESYQETIATTPVAAPELDHFTVDGEVASSDTVVFNPRPGVTTKLDWQTTIGTQPLDVTINPTTGSAIGDLPHTG